MIIIIILIYIHVFAAIIGWGYNYGNMELWEGEDPNLTSSRIKCGLFLLGAHLVLGLLGMISAMGSYGRNRWVMPFTNPNGPRNVGKIPRFRAWMIDLLGLAWVVRIELNKDSYVYSYVFRVPGGSLWATIKTEDLRLEVQLLPGGDVATIANIRVHAWNIRWKDIRPYKKTHKYNLNVPLTRERTLHRRKYGVPWGKEQIKLIG